MASLCRKHIVGALWDFADCPVPSLQLQPQVIDHSHSGSIHKSSTAIAVSLIRHHVPQKVTEMESKETGKAAAHRQFQWVQPGL